MAATGDMYKTGDRKGITKKQVGGLKMAGRRGIGDRDDMGRETGRRWTGDS